MIELTEHDVKAVALSRWNRKWRWWTAIPVFFLLFLYFALVFLQVSWGWTWLPVGLMAFILTWVIVGQDKAKKELVAEWKKITSNS
jgi:hypothetical protein